MNDPIQNHSGVDRPTQPPVDESWRTEVASRVSRYRARCKGTQDNSPAPDRDPIARARSFDARSYATQFVGHFDTQPNAPHNAQPNAQLDNQAPAPQMTGSSAAHSRTARQSLEARNAVHRTRNAFDTNYYRRLNAESLAAAYVMGATVAVRAPEPEEKSEFGATIQERERESDDAAFEPTPDSREAAQAPAAFDLELRDSAPDPEPEHPAAPTQGKLIVFPHFFLEPPLLPKPHRDELAEPMNLRPRILEVPENIMPLVQASLFPDIQLDGDRDEDASHGKSGIEVPLQVAPVAARLLAGLTDWGIVMAASLLFAGMACVALPDIPRDKIFWMMQGAVTLLLWTIYQNLFLLYGGRTPGMSARGIRLSTFDGQTPQWKQRSRRARYIFISFAAAALGFLWALVDEDELCWHDRISRTFPTIG